MDTSGHELYFAHQRAVQTIHGIAVRYRLALIGPRIDVAHSELEPSLPSTRSGSGPATPSC